MMGAQRSVSSLLEAATCWGGIGRAMEPRVAGLSFTSCVFSAACTAVASLLTIDGGVLAGKATPCQDIATNPGSVSAIAGMSGAVNQRSAEVTATARTFPPLAWPRTVGMLPKVI